MEREQGRAQERERMRRGSVSSAPEGAWATTELGCLSWLTHDGHVSVTCTHMQAHERAYAVT